MWELICSLFRPRWQQFGVNYNCRHSVAFEAAERSADAVSCRVAINTNNNMHDIKYECTTIGFNGDWQTKSLH